MSVHQVVFTDTHNVETIRAMRRGQEHATRVLATTLEDTRAARHVLQWREQLEWDDEKDHTVELYVIWNEKSSFLWCRNPSPESRAPLNHEASTRRPEP